MGHPARVIALAPLQSIIAEAQQARHHRLKPSLSKLSALALAHDERLGDAITVTVRRTHCSLSSAAAAVGATICISTEARRAIANTEHGRAAAGENGRNSVYLHFIFMYSTQVLCL
jgi:hypothetical protein